MSFYKKMKSISRVNSFIPRHRILRVAMAILFYIILLGGDVLYCSYNKKTVI